MGQKKIPTLIRGGCPQVTISEQQSGTRAALVLWISCSVRAIAEHVISVVGYRGSFPDGHVGMYVNVFGCWSYLATVFFMTSIRTEPFDTIGFFTFTLGMCQIALTLYTYFTMPRLPFGDDVVMVYVHDASPTA